MNMKGNQKKAEQLGMPIGTAANRLRRMILFDLVRKLGLDTCIRCGLQIEEIEQFSIDHIEPWLDASPDLFWDLDNMGFAHKHCNSAAGRRNPKAFANVRFPYGSSHKDAKLTEDAVRSIRKRYASGEANGPTLAREYKLSHRTIYDAIHRRTWKHVE